MVDPARIQKWVFRPCRYHAKTLILVKTWTLCYSTSHLSYPLSVSARQALMGNRATAHRNSGHACGELGSDLACETLTGPFSQLYAARMAMRGLGARRAIPRKGARVPAKIPETGWFSTTRSPLRRAIVTGGPRHPPTTKSCAAAAPRTR